jgi:phosphomannomutase/phosphoglucomutase
MEEQLLKRGDNIAASIFKAYDIRGVVGKTLTSKTVYDIGRATGSEAHVQGQQSIIVGRDGRLSGAELVQALIAGLRATGRDVIDIGIVPTPLLYFATHYLNTGSGVMLTGSHNPPNYNGMKIMLRDETLALDAIQMLRRRIEAEDYTRGTGGLQAVDIVPAYIQRVTSDVKLARSLKVVVDCGNGAAGEVAPRLLRALGNEVIELYCEIDGRFPHHHPDPSQLENLKDLILKVKEEEADLGLAFDGDGDRLGVIDSSGHVIWPDRQLMLYAMDVLSRQPAATILYDIKCSRHLGQIITEHGGNPIMYKTGHSLIKAKMKETGALLAGEMSGHIFFKERWFGFDDALYTGARLLEILAAHTQSSEEIFASLPDAISTPELRVEMVEGEHFRFMEKLLNQAEFPDAVLTTIDGLRADFEDGWGLVRPSNTTPCLILRFEANDAQALERIENTFKRLMLGIDPSLILPF